MEFRRAYGEPDVLLPFNNDIFVQHDQRMRIVVMNFWIGLPSEFEKLKSQIMPTHLLTRGYIDKLFALNIR